MPNHVTNRVIVTGKEDSIAQLRERVIQLQDGKPHFDFNTLVPMPKELMETEKSSEVDFGLAILGYETQFMAERPTKAFSVNAALRKYMDYPWVVKAGITSTDELADYFRKKWPKCVEKAQKALDCLERYGHSDWYSWSVSEWGTKWNAYEYREASRSRGRWEFVFETAWSIPEPVLEMMAAEYPDLMVEVSSFDEGWNFAAVITYEDGQCSSMEEYGETDKSELEVLHEKVYGYPPESDEDDEEFEFEMSLLTPTSRAAAIILPDKKDLN